MLQNARVTAFTVSLLLTEYQQDRGVKLPRLLPISGLTSRYLNISNQVAFSYCDGYLRHTCKMSAEIE